MPFSRAYASAASRSSGSWVRRWIIALRRVSLKVGSLMPLRPTSSTTLSALCLKNQRTVGTSRPAARNPTNMSTTKASQPRLSPLPSIALSPRIRPRSLLAPLIRAPQPRQRAPCFFYELFDDLGCTLLFLEQSEPLSCEQRRVIPIVGGLRRTVDVSRCRPVKQPSERLGTVAQILLGQAVAKTSRRTPGKDVSDDRIRLDSGEKTLAVRGMGTALPGHQKARAELRP